MAANSPTSTTTIHQPLTISHQPLSWYALYTRPRHEKVVAGQLEDRRIEVFLPLREVLSRWKDRRKLVELPLFPGYLFLHTDLRRKRDIVSAKGAVRLVGFDGTPAPIPEEQVEAVRQVCLTKLLCDPYPYLNTGRPVRVTHGPLTGLTGILVKKKSEHRLILSVDVLQQSVAVEIDAASVEPYDW